jgi:hypothetical protein
MRIMLLDEAGGGAVLRVAGSPDARVKSSADGARGGGDLAGPGQIDNQGNSWLKLNGLVSKNNDRSAKPQITQITQIQRH